MSTEAKKALTEEEKIERHVKGLATRGTNILSEVATLIAELKKAGDKYAKYRVELMKAVQAGVVHGDFPAHVASDPLYLEKQIAQEMARLRVPGSRRIPTHGFKPMVEQFEADFALLKPEFPDDRAARLEQMQREAEAAEEARAKRDRREALVLSGLSAALAENYWPEDEPTLHFLVRWVKKHHDEVVSLEEVKAALKRRGYFDPNMTYNV